MKKYCLITFDLEEFVFPTEHNLNFSTSDRYRISNYGLTSIIKFLKKRNIKSTFFTTTKFALKYPRQIEKIIDEGHEIASHGKSHKDYSKLSDKDCKDELFEGKLIVEKKFNIKLKGFRSPGLKQINSKILENLGFTYDSSLHPTLVPFRYNNLFKSANISKNKIIHIPVSVSKFRFPFSWIWFRNFGFKYSFYCTKSCLNYSNYVLLYFHPWEFYNLDRIKIKGVYWSLYKNNSGDKLISNLNSYCDFTYDIGLNHDTISSFINKLKL